MFEYLVKRFLQIPVTLLGVFAITFALLFIVPGDPVSTLMGEKTDKTTHDALQHELGLDRPLHIQFCSFLGACPDAHGKFTGIIEGNLGQSFITKRSVNDAILDAFPHTLALAVMSVLIMTVIGIPVGIISAIKQRSLLDRIVMVGAIGGVSAPSFWIGLMVLYVFIFNLRLFPMNPLETISMGPGPYLGYLLLPATVMGVRGVAIVARLTRSTLLEVVRQDYIRMARAKGVAESVVIFKHALRNALIPVITYVGMDLAFTMGGAVVTETVFAWPGLGRLAVQALRQKDIPMVLGTVLFTATLIVVANLVTDLSYALVDPRVKLGKG